LETKLTFDDLIISIQHVHEKLAAQAGKAVNIGLTLRNWIIGYYIQEYEQNGSDRAKYGKNLLNKLSKRLSKMGITGMATRSLRQYRKFYQIYPQIWQSVSANSLQKLNAYAAAGPWRQLVLA